MCPICGTALNLSASPQADRERAFIRRQIAAGKTKDQIKDELVAQYGTQVLAEPPKSGFDLTAWLVPGAAILIAAVAIALGLRRLAARREGRRRITAGEAARPSTPPTPSDSTPTWRATTSELPARRSPAAAFRAAPSRFLGDALIRWSRVYTFPLHDFGRERKRIAPGSRTGGITGPN